MNPCELVADNDRLVDENAQLRADLREMELKVGDLRNEHEDCSDWQGETVKLNKALTAAEQELAPLRSAGVSSESVLNRCVQLEKEAVAERAETARLRTHVVSDADKAMADARDVCWHCKDCLEPTVPRCERCPLPGECDDEDCQAEGCVARRAEHKP